jgi:hypothetical protein
MHSRKEILKNQKKFSREIKTWFKNDLNDSVNQLYEIETDDEYIIQQKEKLTKKFQKIKLNKEIKKFLINENNVYPKFYAWWDELNEKVEIILYEKKQEGH